MAALRTRDPYTGGIHAEYRPFAAEGADGLEAWIDALCGLSPEVLRGIGRGYRASRATERAHAAAQRRLTAVITEESFAVDAWLVADRIETICHLASAQLDRMAHDARHDMLTARVAAEWAALAIALEPRLTPLDVDTLTAPFAPFITAARLRLV